MPAAADDFQGRCNEAASEILQFRNRFAQHELEKADAARNLANEQAAHADTKRAHQKQIDELTVQLQGMAQAHQENAKLRKELADAQTALKQVTEEANKRIVELTAQLQAVQGTPQWKEARATQLRESIQRAKQAAEVGAANEKELAEIEASMEPKQ